MFLEQKVSVVLDDFGRFNRGMKVCQEIVWFKNYRGMTCEWRWEVVELQVKNMTWVFST